MGSSARALEGAPSVSRSPKRLRSAEDIGHPGEVLRFPIDFDIRIQTPANNVDFDSRLHIPVHTDQFADGELFRNFVNNALSNTCVVNIAQQSQEPLLDLRGAQETAAETSNLLVAELSGSINMAPNVQQVHESQMSQRRQVGELQQQDLRRSKLGNDQRASITHGRHLNMQTSLGSAADKAQTHRRLMGNADRKLTSKQYGAIIVL